MDDVQEVSCYVRALELGVQRIREEHPITFRLITDMHQALMTSGRGINKAPGEFRKNQVWIGAHRADEATFVPTPANELANLGGAIFYSAVKLSKCLCTSVIRLYDVIFKNLTICNFKKPSLS